MTSEFYIQQWKKTLLSLERIICIDTEYQKRKAHDKQLCDAALRLSGVLGSYLCCYNDALDCLQQNLQVQKTAYMQEIVKAVVARILELKEQLRKLDGSYYEYLSGGLIKHKLTCFDVELKDIPTKHQRPENIQRLLENAFQKSRKLDKEELQIVRDSTVIDRKVNWWESSDIQEEDNTKHSGGINIQAIYEVEKKISEETLRRKNIISLIQAHEKSRQILQKYTLKNQRRVLWEKELKGTLKPSAPLALRERGAKIIQKVLRGYFELKRKRVRDCQLDEVIGIKHCKQVNHINLKEEEEKLKSERCKLFKEYDERWKIEYSKKAKTFIKKRGDDIGDDLREFIRDWFKKWFEEVKFIYPIPKQDQGGLAKILREEVPSPFEWLEKCKAYMEQKKDNKNKTAIQLKWEKMEARREEMILKKEEIRKKKLQAELLKKIMKNPNMHPGYHYPQSKKIENLIKNIEEYNRKWSDFDEINTVEVKEALLSEMNFQNICAGAKESICNMIDEDIRHEFNKLMAALKEDYKRNGLLMPENIKEKLKRSKKKRKAKILNEDDIFEKLHNFAAKGFLVEYPMTKFEDFLEDFNFAGDNLRCSLRIVQPFGGETRSVWWEKCRELSHCFRRILLVGPRHSGKTVLVHAMASVNEATLYDLNPVLFQEETVHSLKQFVSALVLCAQATQPSVIYIRHIHTLYQRKVPVNEAIVKSALLKKLLVRNLIKKIHKMDKITLIGSCIDPWRTKSKQLTKHFPSVVLMPQTSYSTTQLILRNWVSSNRVIPSTLDTQRLSRMLQGYSLGYLKSYLEGFLTPDRIIKIAAYGLTPTEIYDYFLQNDSERKADYEKYQKWYSEKTHWGKIEMRHLEEQIEFKHNVEMWKEKIEKKRNLIQKLTSSQISH